MWKNVSFPGTLLIASEILQPGFRNPAKSHVSKFHSYLLVALPLLMLSCLDRGPNHVKRMFFRMDTVTDVTIVAPKSRDMSRVWRGIDSLLLDWEHRFSVSGESSEVRALNERKSSSMIVSNDLAEMLRQGIAYGDTLDGAFDITILPVKELWGLGEESQAQEPLPSPAQIAEALKRVNYRLVRIDTSSNEVLFSSPQTRIDVGGIAKGYVLREIREYLKNQGISSFLIAAGGDVLGAGARYDGRPWVIGIQHPRSSSSVFATLSLDSGTIVTSGDYERYRIVDGQRYHHIFDSHTGYSCSLNQSVTIWSIDPTEADIFSTGLFCRSAQQILDFVEARGGRLETIVVDSLGAVFVSSGWKHRIYPRKMSDSKAL